MPKPKSKTNSIWSWLSKGWVQWSIAALFFFLLSWLYMGHAISDCSTTTTALGTDSTGGFGWIQWAGGNDLSWGHSNVSNYPDGEDLNKPQYITSALLIFIYKILASLSTPICGLNLVVLLGYMSTGLLMFGLVKWLLKRFDVALFAGYAAAFVPYHQFKALSHVNYVSASIFIAVVWVYLWFISKPSYKRAALLSLISAAGFYYDGYFILITAVLLGALLISSFGYDTVKFLLKKSNKQTSRNALIRLRYIAFSVALLAILLLPILYTYKTHGTEIKNSLAAVRSEPRRETFNYGLKPIEFLLPAANNPLMSDSYFEWREKKLHGSNFSESTLYLGYTVMILAVISLIALFYKPRRREKLKEISYPHIIFALSLAAFACFILSLPASVTIYGHTFSTPVDYLVKLTANWRVLARLFLAIDPLVIILASLGLYAITKNWRRHWQLVLSALCTVVLFMEYLPSTFNPTSDLYKDAPRIYRQLEKDPNVKLVAEYPFADFTYSPSIFTYQPVHKKLLLNANDSNISRGPLDASIAGLNDPQTVGILRQLKVDVIIVHGAELKDNKLKQYNRSLTYNKAGKVQTTASLYSYKIANYVKPRDSILEVEKGYNYLSVDKNQISHRAVKNGTMKVVRVNSSAVYKSYKISFAAGSLCGAGKSAKFKVTQSGKILWAGTVGRLTAISLSVVDAPIDIQSSCGVDITRMSVDAGYK